MAGFSEKLAGIKAKQEQADAAKKEQAEAAAEAARTEKEGKRNELVTRRDELTGEFQKAEQTAVEANQAIAEADAFALEQGDNLDPEVASEIASMKAEAQEAQERFEELKAQFDSLNAEIDSFEESSQDEEKKEGSIGENPPVSPEAHQEVGNKILGEEAAPESAEAEQESAEQVEGKGSEEERSVEQSKEERLAELQDALKMTEADLNNAKATKGKAEYEFTRYKNRLESSAEDLEGMVRITANRSGESRLIDVAKTNELQAELIANKNRYDAVQDRYNAKIAQFRAENPDLRNMASANGEELIVARDPELQKMREQMKEIDPNNNFGPYAGFDLNNFTVGTRAVEEGSLLTEMPAIEGEMPRRDAYEKIAEYLRVKAEESAVAFEQAQTRAEELKAQIAELSPEPAVS